VNGILRDQQQHLGGSTVFDVAEGALDRLTGEPMPDE
jgi:hypothetical protein